MGRIIGASLLIPACTPIPTPAAAPKPTIVSLNPCTDAILAEVADPAQLLAISSYSHDPAASSLAPRVAARFPATRGTVEEVLALKPDLVIDGNFTAPASRDAFVRLGLKLEQLPIAATVPESIAQVRRLALLAGQVQRGEALVRRIEAAVVGARWDGAKLPAIVWQSGGIVAGQRTLIDDLLMRTGFANAAAQRGLAQASYLPLEAMLANPPQVIFVAGSAQASEDRLLRHPVLAGLRDTRRALLEPSLLWCGGPTIVRAVVRLGEVRRSFETGLRLRPSLRSELRSVPPQDERSNRKPVRPEEQIGVSPKRSVGSKAGMGLEGPAA